MDLIPLDGGILSTQLSRSWYIVYALLAWYSVSLTTIVGIVVLDYYNGKIHNRVCGSMPSFHIRL